MANYMKKELGSLLTSYHCDTFKQLGDRYVTIWEGDMCHVSGSGKKKN